MQKNFKSGLSAPKEWPVRCIKRNINFYAKNLIVIFFGLVLASIFMIPRNAQGQGPNEASIVNNFIPSVECLGLNCTFKMKDIKTNAIPQFFPTNSLLFKKIFPSSCGGWIIGCTVRSQYVVWNPGFSLSLPAPPFERITDNGVTFEVKIYPIFREDGEVGDVISMPGAFSIRTIGQRLGLHTAQSSRGLSGFNWDETPWEPIDHGAERLQDIYYTFMKDGRVRIDQFTPLPGGYIWEESVNDGGVPVGWNGDGTFDPFVLGPWQLGGATPSTVGFNQFVVFNHALSKEEMINEENFANRDNSPQLSTDNVPCNSGLWINSGTYQTPCGAGTNLVPPPAPPQLSAPLLENEVPSFSAFFQGGFAFKWGEPLFAPSPIGETMWLDTWGSDGVYRCHAPVEIAETSYPGGDIIGAQLEANYGPISSEAPDPDHTASVFNARFAVQQRTDVSTASGWTCGVIADAPSNDLIAQSIQLSSSGSAATNPPPPGVSFPNAPGRIGPTPSKPVLNPSAPPGTNFDLSVWELQLPTGSPGLPDTISPSRLSGGYTNPPYFLTNSSDGGMEMTDPGTDCVTTPHSTHCRTELREMNPDGTPASWSPNGTNKLDATLVVTNPGDSVVIGQIHLDDSKSTKPLVELYYDSSGNIRAGVEETVDGGQDPTAIGHVQVGTPFSYELNYSQNQLSISINGGIPVPLGTNSVGGLPVYFKAGDYGQTSSPSTVEFYKLAITHTGSSLNTSVPPGGNFDLSVWELQLPTGASPGHPTTISNSQLEGGYQDSFFFTSDPSGSMGMKDPGGDPATGACVATPNSTHCRTELREVNKDGSQAFWLANGFNTLKATLAVVNPGGSVNIGQIHLADYISSKPLCQLFYDSQGNIEIGVEHTLPGGDETRVRLTNIPVGQTFSYELSYSNNLLSVIINGGAPTFLSTWDIGHFPVYFKAGAYGQTTAPSDVHFFSLQIFHKDPTINKNGHPGDNFNFTHWELQLPTGTPGDVDTISNSRLEAGYESKYFFTNSPDGSLGMKDPGTNCVATSNSGHCRTELREVNADGSLAKWLPNGVNILHVSMVVDDPGGKVNIGQIHLDESVSTKPLCQLFYDSTGMLTMGVEQTTAGGNEKTFPVGHVDVGTPFSFAIQYTDNQLSVTLNGGAPILLPTFSLGGLPVYFKAGAYGQTTAPVDLHIYDVRITHD